MLTRNPRPPRSGSPARKGTRAAGGWTGPRGWLRAPARSGRRRRSAAPRIRRSVRPREPTFSRPDPPNWASLASPDRGRCASERGVVQIFGPRNLCEQFDDLRRWQGRLLEWVGLGPVKTPSRVMFSERGVRLHTYEDSNRLGPVLVIVSAPIKRTYIWDLVPWASVVLRCIRNGIRVFLIEWAEPEFLG